MIMDVKIISMERIKPSFPTPNHLKHFKLCSLDQLNPAAYAPIVIYYPNQDSSSYIQVLEKIDLLKKSLSKILTRFFPLAGTIKDKFSIDCDDQGASFTTAKARNRLTEFLESPELNLISQFLPNNMIESCVTNIQTTAFACGGIAIGLCISHRILDGTGLSFFLKSWAKAAFSHGKVLLAPDFSSASSLFPGNGSSNLKNTSIAMWGSLFKEGSFVTKRFVFDRQAIAGLKNKANGIRPSRVQAVSAFIWKCAMDACEEKNCSKKPSLISHVVDLRKRAGPNLSERSIGNLIWFGRAKITGEERDKFGFLELVDEVKKSVLEIDGEFVKKLEGDGGLCLMLDYMKEMERFGEGVDYFGFSSWNNMGFYDIDFGWGRPVWVSSVEVRGPFFMNLCILVETRCGEGMEAWVTLDEEEMDMLEKNQEFRGFASLNPSPLHVGDFNYVKLY